MSYSTIEPTEQVMTTNLSGGDTKRLQGTRVGMVTFSAYPFDPRVRRAVDALVGEGATVDMICLASDNMPRREAVGNVSVLRVPLKHDRRGKVGYFYRYAAFITICSLLLAFRTLEKRYKLIYVHNMPDVLVVCGLIPKILGAKVILDLHDPMPELMTTIFQVPPKSWSVSFMRFLEKWSVTRANLVITVNIACHRLFSMRSCRKEKIAVVMNTPDERIFRYKAMQFNAKDHRDGQPFVVMYHGSLVERNGLEVAIDALEHVRKVVPSVELHVFGSKTDFLDRMMNKVKERNLQDAVRYFGPKRQEELIQVIERCDLGVIPNHRNPFTELNTPTRIFEYLALGRPIIAPSTPGITDYFNENSLLFFEAGNSGDLARQIEYAYSHPREIFEVTRRGQEVYLAHTWEAERRTLVTRVSDILKG